MQYPEPTDPETGAVPTSEAARLAALHRLAVLDSAPEPVFDALTAAAAQVCNVPIALLSLVDAQRQWFKSNVGLDGVTETPRAVAFCDHAIGGDQLFEVADARLDARFAANPLVTGRPDIRFYAGAPIVMPGGERIGTVCVIDRQPRVLDAAQRRALEGLSRVASAALETRLRHVATMHELALSEARYRAIVEDQSEMISLARRDLTLSFVNAAYARHFGQRPAEMTGRSLLEFVNAGDRDAVRSHLEATLAGGQPRPGLNRMQRADGIARWVSWINRPLCDADGTVIGLQSVGRDITEQRLAERSLADSERRYRSLYESTPAIMHSIDAQGRLLHVSDRWLEVLGYEREQVIGRPSSDFLAAESAQRARESVLPAFFRTGRCDRVPYQLVRGDGSLIDVLLSAILERDAEGVPYRSLAVLENITETKRLTAELGATHARLDTIVDNVPALLAHWDVDGVTRFANRQYQAALGLPLERIIDRPLQQIYAEVDPLGYGTLAPHVAEVLKGRRQEFELAMLTTDGLRQLRMTLVPEQPEAGRVVGFFGMAHDVTGRRALELRLRESEERYRSLFEHLNSGFALHEIVVDADGTPVDYRFLAMNAPFSAMVGLAPEEAIGRRVTELRSGLADDAADWIGVYGAVVQSGIPRHFEHRSAALQRWFEVVAYRPAPGQFAVIAQDITHRKLAEDHLQAALQEKETLLKEVYHRVKNNLQVVQSLLNLQRRSVPEGIARSALEESVQRVRAMALVHEKLYQSGNLAAVSLADYAQDLLKQIGDATGAARRNIALQADIAPIQAKLDNAVPFGLLVAELVGNALKHAFDGRSGGVVRVELAPVDGGARLAVTDDGGGLATDFEMESVDSMGLQLAASLARQLGGTLRAESAAGSVFSAVLAHL